MLKYETPVQISVALHAIFGSNNPNNESIDAYYRYNYLPEATNI